MDILLSSSYRRPTFGANEAREFRQSLLTRLALSPVSGNMTGEPKFPDPGRTDAPCKKPSSPRLAGHRSFAFAASVRVTIPIYVKSRP